MPESLIPKHGGYRDLKSFQNVVDMDPNAGFS